MKRLARLVALLALLMPASCAPPPAPEPDGAGLPTVQVPVSSPSARATALPAGQAPLSRPLVVAMDAEAASMDPHQDDHDYAQKAQRGPYESLLGYIPITGGQAIVGPGLAASYNSDDNRVWLLVLRKGIKFTDGTSLTADAVKYNFDRLLGMKLAPAKRLPAIASVEAVDDLTVRITLVSPSPILPDCLTRLLMVSPTAAKAHAAADDPWGAKWLSEHAVGTGPYLLLGWVKGQSITLVKNSDYWRGWQGSHVEKIILRLVKDAIARRSLLQSGDVDVAEGIAFDDLATLSKTPGVTVQAHDQPSMAYLMLRPQGPLKLASVRRALQMAFDYDGFIKGVLDGRARYAQGPLPSPLWAFDGTLPAATQDITAAKRLLANAGYPAGSFTLTIATASSLDWYQPREAEALQSGLKAVGITATIQNYTDLAAYTASISPTGKGPDVYCWTVTSYLNDPDESLRRVFYSGLVPEKGGDNYTRYSNPAFDSLLDKAITATTNANRLAMYQQAQKTLTDDAVAIFAGQPSHVTTMREWVQGYVYVPFAAYSGYAWYDLWLSK
jgi:peptide/nickel transport system substrate-binding protein